MVILNKTDYIANVNSILETKPRFWHSAHPAKMATPQRSNSEYNAAYCSYTKTICFLLIHTISFDRLALSGRACTAFSNIQERCATSTHPVYDRFSATPAGQISIFSSQTGSHSLFEQLHTGLFHL